MKSTVLDPGKEVKKWNVENEKKRIYLYLCLLFERYVFPIPIKQRVNLVLFLKRDAKHYLRNQAFFISKKGYTHHLHYLV